MKTSRMAILAMSGSILIAGNILAQTAPPVLDPIGPQTVYEESNLNFVVSATDADGLTPDLAAADLPPGASFIDHGNSTGTFDWTPDYFQSGTYYVTFYALDSLTFDSDSEIVEITVLDVNQYPILDSIAPQTVAEGDTLMFTVIATDPDGTTPQLSVQWPPAGVDFIDQGDGTGLFFWRPDYTQSGVYWPRFVARDAVYPNDTDWVDVQITVTNTNLPPILDSIGNKTVAEGDILSFLVTASDPDQTLTYFTTSALPTNAWFTDFLDNSGEFYWQPDSTQAGMYEVTFYAHDGELTDSEVVTIEVTDTNRPPVLDSIGNKTVAESANLNFLVTASDPDGTIPVMLSTPLPTGATYTDHLDGTGTFDWTPGFDNEGWYEITFIADDGERSDSEIVTINVTNSNAPPVLDSIGDKTVAEGANLYFEVYANEPYDLTTPVLTVSPLPTNAWFIDNLDGTGIFNFDPDYTQWGWYAITFYATDDSSAVDSEMIYIEVTNAGGTLIVTTLADTGEGSLRYAIDLANTHIGADTIIFGISGTIALWPSPLPLTDGGTLILGATAPGGARSIALDGQDTIPAGFDVSSENNFIRDLVLTNFNEYAIRLTAGSNTITGCHLNLDPSGTIRGTSGGGLEIDESGMGNVIGGCSESDRNVIAGGGGNPGIHIRVSDSNLIMGNYIGLAASGSAPLVNPVLTEAGIIIDTAWNFIGGYDPACGNIISGNATGIQIFGNTNRVFRNYIGLDRQGNPLGNGSSGIMIGESSGPSYNNTVNHNTIAFNGGNGIEVLGSNSSGNSFASNEIYENGLLAIDLGGDGVTINDPGDGDTGPNGLHNFPEIDSIISLLDETYVIYGMAGANDLVEFFVAHPANDSTRPADPSGYGEAYIYLDGAFASPAGDFSYQTDLSVAPFSLLSCTATDPGGNTSEMSENFLLMPKPLLVVAYGYLPPLDRNPVTYQNFINIMVYDPIGNRFGKDSLGNLIDEIAGAEYWETSNDSVVIPDPIVGEYTFQFIGESGAPEGALYSAIIKTDGLEESVVVSQNSVPLSGESDSAGYTYDEGGYYVNGDANTDGRVNISDAVYIVAYVFSGGPPPNPFLSGDTDCNLDISVEDAVYILDYIFRGGAAPCYFEL